MGPKPWQSAAKPPPEGRAPMQKAGHSPAFACEGGEDQPSAGLVAVSTTVLLGWGRPAMPCSPCTGAV